MQTICAMNGGVLVVLGLAGCMNMTMRLQPDDLTVKPTYEGSDCVTILLGIGVGTATVDAAMANGRSMTSMER